MLPNSPNVLMAAERAAELSEKLVRVVPTRSQQAGLAAAVALEPSRRGAAATPPRWRRPLEHVRTGGVTEAARDDAAGRFRRGDAVGFVDERARRLGRAARDAARSCSARSAARPSCSP